MSRSSILLIDHFWVDFRLVAILFDCHVFAFLFSIFLQMAWINWNTPVRCFLFVWDWIVKKIVWRYNLSIGILFSLQIVYLSPTKMWLLFQFYKEFFIKRKLNFFFFCFFLFLLFISLLVYCWLIIFVWIDLGKNIFSYASNIIVIILFIFDKNQISKRNTGKSDVHFFFF